MTTLRLYGTSHCHLCELAKSEVEAFMPFARSQIKLLEIDIVEDDALYEELEEKIPVLENAETGNRLYWPFNTTELVTFC